MSLLRNLERRDYTDSGQFYIDPSIIPTNGELAPSPLLWAGRGALRHWAVWACSRVIADSVSTLPVDLLQGTGANATPVDPLPPILQKPSAYLDRVDWLSQVLVALLTTGNVYGLIASRDYYEYPTQINLVHPGQITAVMDPETGKKIYRSVNGRTLSNEQVWHRTGLVWPGDVVGLDPVAYFVRTITLGLEAERYGAEYYQNGAHPTAVASTDQPVDQVQAETIKNRIRKAVSHRDIAVLGAGLKLDRWQGSPNDAMLVETIHMNAAMVCAIYGVPPEKLGVSAGNKASVTYANREERAQDFLNDAVNPWLVRMESSMTDWFPRGRFVKFNTGGLLKSDLSTRFAAYEQATGGKPFMLPSEARALENWPPVPGIDDEVGPEPANEPTNDPEAQDGSQG